MATADLPESDPYNAARERFAVNSFPKSIAKKSKYFEATQELIEPPVVTPPGITATRAGDTEQRHLITAA